MLLQFKISDDDLWMFKILIQTIPKVMLSKTSNLTQQYKMT